MGYKIVILFFLLIGALSDVNAQGAQDYFDSFKHYRLSNADSALKYAKLTIIQAEAENDNLLLVKGNNAAGYILNHTGNLRQAINHYTTAYEIAGKCGFDDQRIFLSNNLGLAWYNLSAYDKALEYYLISLDLRKEQSDDTKLAIVKNNIGLVYYKLKQYNNAIKFFEESKIIYQENNNKQSAFAAGGNIALCLIGLQNYDQAIDIYNGIINDTSAKDTSLLVEIFSGLGIAYFNKADESRAVENFQLSEQYASGFTNKTDRVVNNHYLSLLALKQKKYDSSRHYLNKSMRLAQELNSALWLKNNYYIASKLEEVLGNNNEALAYQKQYNILTDSLVNGSIIEKITNLQHEYDNKKYEDYLSSANADLARTNNLNVLLEVLVLLLTGFGLFYYFSSSRKNKTNKLISEAYAEIEYKKQMLEHQIAAQHIPDKVHADISQFILKTTEDLKDPLEKLKGFCNIAMVDVKDPVAVKYFNKVEVSSDRINSVLNRLDDIYYITNAKISLTKINLYEFTSDIVNSIDKDLRSDILYNLVIPEDLVIKADERLLRIALKNLICNAFKFRIKNSADFSFVSVSYKKEENEHRIEVIDNGYGIEQTDIENIFNKNKNSQISGLGLHLAALAIQQLKGNIYVDSLPLVRTSFTISLPVKQNIGIEV